MAKSSGFFFDVLKWRGSRSVQRMSFAERGVYLEMLIEQWEKRNLPDSAEAVADALATTPSQVAEVLAAWEAVRAKFISSRGGGARIYNAALERTRRLQVKNRRQKEQAGYEGAMRRWKGGDPQKRTPWQRLKDARAKGTHTDAEWKEMVATYQRCLKCGITADRLYGKVFTKDHIVPLHLNGDDSIQNIQPLCRSCNITKGDDSTDYRHGLSETKPEWLNKHLTSHPVKSDSTSLAFTADKTRQDMNRSDLTRSEETSTRSKRPVYQSDRFVVFDWQLDEFAKMLGPHFDGFDLHGWFDDLSRRSREHGLVIPTQRQARWDWLQAQTLAEAQRRGLPIAHGPPAKSADSRAPSLDKWAAYRGAKT